MKIEDKVFDVIKGIRPEVGSVISLDSNLFEDLGFESISMLELLIELEEVFQCEIDFEEIDMYDLNSIANICTLVRKSLSMKEVTDE